MESVCINQIDQGERQRQVSDMSHVYTYAQRDLVCLGERLTSDSVLTVEYLEKIAGYKLPLEKKPEMRSEYLMFTERTFVCLYRGFGYREVSGRGKI